MARQTVSSKGAPQMSPRGTERVRRRADQARHAEQALAEGANLTSPEGPEKQAAIKANQEKQLARFGESRTSERRVRQAENKAAAEVQEALLPPLDSGRPVLVPGQQATLQQTRLMAMAHDNEERDMINDAAKAAGRAVRDTLIGKVEEGGNPYLRQRHVVEHNARAERIAQQTAASVAANVNRS